MSCFKLKKCMKCGALVETIKDCTCENCGVQCCGEPMVELKENSVECSIEKHLPVYEIEANYIVVTVNHVMEGDHFIEFIAFENNGVVGKKYFKPGNEIKAVFPYVKGSKIFAYCNKHGLWSKVVE